MTWPEGEEQEQEQEQGQGEGQGEEQGEGGVACFRRGGGCKGPRCRAAAW